MSEYIYLFRGGTPSGSPEEMQQQMQKWADWAKALGSGGYLRSGDPLEKCGKVVRGREKSVTDGLISEAGYAIGGYMIVACSDLNEAVELSKGCPIFDSDGYVEVRSIMKLSA